MGGMPGFLGVLAVAFRTVVGLLPIGTTMRGFRDGTLGVLPETLGLL